MSADALKFSPLMAASASFQSYYFVGFVMIGFGIAFVAALTIEAPFVALEKLLLGGKATNTLYMRLGGKVGNLEI